MGTGSSPATDHMGIALVGEEVPVHLHVLPRHQTSYPTAPSLQCKEFFFFKVVQGMREMNTNRLRGW